MRFNSQLFSTIGVILFVAMLGCGEPDGPTAEEIENSAALTPEPLNEKGRMSEPIQPLQNK